ncbi:response regulator [Chitiniphilus purpureus]|nr:response regulator [Chitiniphilus sp. CD1]
MAAFILQCGIPTTQRGTAWQWGNDGIADILASGCHLCAASLAASVGVLALSDLENRRYDRAIWREYCRAGYAIVARWALENTDRGLARRGNMSNLAGIKVMVIDDSNTIRRSAEIFLGQAGCEVILAEDGFDALAKISDHQPDVVFVDVMMPRLDGYQTCSLIKKNPRYKSTPVIMLSSKDGLFDRARGRMVGSDEYLTKPFTKDSLLAAVDAHVLPAG